LRPSFCLRPLFSFLYRGLNLHLLQGDLTTSLMCSITILLSLDTCCVEISFHDYLGIRSFVFSWKTSRYRVVRKRWFPPPPAFLRSCLTGIIFSRAAHVDETFLPHLSPASLLCFFSVKSPLPPVRPATPPPKFASLKTH